MNTPVSEKTGGGACPAPSDFVAIGGGTGLPLVLRAARSLGIEPVAIVTMADDGGSSGRLRRELGIVPPGDVRNCLSALVADEGGTLARLLSYRFEQGEGIAGHALGNLMLTALADVEGGFAASVRAFERLLDVRGRVLPSTYDAVMLQGFDRAGAEIYGQASLAHNPVAIADVKLAPEAPAANPEAVAALARARHVVICPGSLFTSIIPNLLVPDILAALLASPAQVLYCCNVANMLGETADFTVSDYVDALEEHGLSGRIDTVLIPDGMESGGCVDALTARGMRVRVARLASAENAFHHDAAALAGELGALLAGDYPGGGDGWRAG